MKAPYRSVSIALAAALFLSFPIGCAKTDTDKSATIKEIDKSASVKVYTSLPSDIVDKRTGVKISFDHSVETMPEHWRGSDISAQSFPLEVSEVGRSEKAVSEALSAYPAHILSDNLVVVYVVKDIQFYGMSYGATYYVDSIYLSNEGRAMGFTAEYLRESIHHEFSSILLQNYPSNLNVNEWNKGNVDQFRYTSDGIEALTSGQSDLNYSDKYHKLGFLNQYGSSSQEEDFNTFAEGLFSGRSRFWDAVDGYPLVRAKADATISFYESLDSSMNEQYFRKLKY